jgi:hypothetical protein
MHGETRSASSRRRTSTSASTRSRSTAHGRGRESGVEIAAPWAQVVRWRDGLGVYFNAYPRREDALKELDMSEDALEPIEP